MIDYEELVGNPSEYLQKLRVRREAQKALNKASGATRMPLTGAERKQILAKTDGRCHICGGDIIDQWHADHVRSHSSGGEHSVENYLASHASCNNYRWDYLPEEFEIILKLGVLARTQIENETELGQTLAKSFQAKERQRIKRAAKRGLNIKGV